MLENETIINSISIFDEEIAEIYYAVINAKDRTEEKEMDEEGRFYKYTYVSELVGYKVVSEVNYINGGFNFSSVTEKLIRL